MTVTEGPFNPIVGVQTVTEEARRTLHAVEAEVSTLVTQIVPGYTGRLRRAMRPRYTDTETGAELLITAVGVQGHVTLNEIVRWVERGTAGAGLGGFKAKRGRAMQTPWGPRARVKGQHPNPFVVRLQDAGTRRVDAAAVRGAEVAARKAERVTA